MAESYPISVIIPTHNPTGVVESCLGALLRNDLTNVEIIIVDDGSTDPARQELARYLALEGLNARCLRRDRRGGPAKARNDGLQHAANDYLLFLDSDVLLPPQGLEWLRETLDLYSHRPEVGGVLGTYSEDIPARDFLTNFKNLYTCYLYRATETRSPYIHTAVFCVKKNLLQSQGGFDPAVEKGEDFRLGITLGSRGYRFVIDRRIRSVHLKHYSLRRLLREDWERIQAMSRLKLGGEERRFSYGAHRYGRLVSLALPGLLLLGVAIGGVRGLSALTLIAGLTVFAAINAGFFRYMRRWKGWAFASAGLGFLFFEMLWAEVSLAAAVIRLPFGRS